MLPRRGWYLCKHNACNPCGLVVLHVTSQRFASMIALQLASKQETIASPRLAKIVPGRKCHVGSPVGPKNLELGAYGSVLELQKLRLVDNAKSRCFFTKKWY